MHISKDWRGMIAVALIWFIGVGPLFSTAHFNTAYGRDPAGDPEAMVEPSVEETPHPDEDESPELKVARQFLQTIAETGRHPFDEFRLLEQTTKKGRDQNVDWKNIGFRILDANNNVIFESFARDYFDASNTDFIDLNLPPAAKADRFVITYRDEIIHRFAMEPKAIGFFKNYFVFYETENYVAADGHANISFIDLERYASSLSKERLPVYRIPIKTSGPEISLAQRGDNLEITRPNSHPIELSAAVFEEFSKLQTVGLNLMSNLADPATYDDTVELATQTNELFEGALNLAGREVEAQKLSADVAREDVLRSLTAAVESRAAIGSIPQGAEATQKALSASYGNEIKKSGKLEKVLGSLKKNRVSQQKLLSRVRALFSRLTLPAPKHAPESIYQALVQSLGSMLGVVHEKGALKEGVLQLLHKKKLYVGAGALFVAATHGDPTIGAFYQQGLDVASSLFWMMWGKAYSLADLTAQAFSATASGFFKPWILYENYIAGDNLKHLTVGMTAAFAALGTILGVPHIITNTVSLTKDLWNEGRTPEQLQDNRTWWAAKWWGVMRELVSFDTLRAIPSLPRRFVERQDRRQLEYLKNLGESDVAAGTAVSEFSPEEEQEIAQIITELKEQQGGILKTLKNFGRRLGLFKKVEGENSETASHRIQSFGQAFRHFLFSACSFTISGETYARMWNGWFMFRSMVLRPVMTATFLYYPTYFRTIINNKDGTALPSVYNGGLRPFYQHEWLRLRQFFGDQTLPMIEEVEKTLSPLEDKVEQIALRQTLRAMVEELDEFKDLEKLISKGKLPTVTSDVMASLTTSHRNFFQQHFMRLKDAMMARILKDLTKDELTASEAAEANIDQLKYSLADKLLPLQDYDDVKLTALAQQIESDERIISDSRRYASSWWERLKNFTERHNLNIAQKLDPHSNTQVERYSSVQRQLGNAQALARAVRATMASIMVDKPLEIAFLLVCLAGITEGLNQPLHNEMFSENAWFYLGRYPFLTGYLTNVVTQTLADIWMKLQQDEQNEGSFGKRPDANFKGKSFRSWYVKKFFDKENTWWKNQKHYIKIIWANMRAALVMYLATNLLTLGRLDLDMYLTGYLMAYLLPLNGVAFKAEQAFELATGYFKRDIPEKYDSHPLTQKYLMERSTSARLWFNFYYKTYENITGFMLSNLQTIQTKMLGTRSFVRWIFGGYTPTELTANALQGVRSTVSFVPGMEKVIDACQTLFTHNYTDGEKFIDGVKK